MRNLLNQTCPEDSVMRNRPRGQPAHSTRPASSGELIGPRVGHRASRVSNHLSLRRLNGNRLPCTHRWSRSGNSILLPGSTPLLVENVRIAYHRDGVHPHLLRFTV